MSVMIIASKECSHCKTLSKELIEIGVKHDVVYAEDDPELCHKLSIRHSPSLVVDEQIVFREQVNEIELRKYFKCH